MLEKNYKYISADNHINTHWLPKGLWQERLPKRLRDIGPRVIETARGSYWSWEGRIMKRSADGSNWSRCVEQEFDRVELPERALPPSQPGLVRQHMDEADIYAAVFYGDTRKWLVEDPVLLVEMYRAYNDFCLELSAAEPGRLIYLPNLPTANRDAALAEFHRLADLGVKAVEFSVFDVGEPLGSMAWEPLWDEAADRDIVICSHTGHGAGVPFPPNEGGAALIGHAVSPFVAARPIAEMVFTGVFERHPELIWVMAECRIGWLPFLFASMDRQFDNRPSDPSVSLSMTPSAYVRRNIRFTFEYDVVGSRLIGEDWSLLAETVMWSCDYPHPQNIWPNPASSVEDLLGGLDVGLHAAVLYGRAAEVHGIDFPLPSSSS